MTSPAASDQTVLICHTLRAEPHYRVCASLKRSDPLLALSTRIRELFTHLSSLSIFL